VRWPVVLALVAVAACSFEDVDLDGKTCPCAAGWECDPGTLRCVPLAPRDGGFDARLVDGDTPPDAPARDGRVPIDAPGVDAPPVIDADLDAPFDGGFDAGPDETGCDDVHAGAMLCDGFEAGAGFPDWWMNRGAAYATDPVYRGNYSILVHSSVASTLAYLYESFEEVTSGELYGRAYVYVASDQTAESLVILHLEESGSPYDYAELQIQGGVLRVGARNRTAGFEYVNGPPMPRDRWVCIELGFAIGTSATIELSVDGVPAASLPHDTTRTMPWRILYAGISNRGSAQTGTVELYMDEIVLSRSPIGCD
jgi:hypothetical protein